MNQRPVSLKQEPCRGAPGCYCAPDWYAGCSCTCHNGSGQPQPAPRNAWHGLKRTGFRRKPKTEILVNWQTEAAFQKQVEDLAHYCGYMTSHAHLPFFDTAGTPDLLIVHPKTGRTMFVELKARTKTGRLPKPSPAQQRWLNALAIKNEVYVWTWPDSWDELEAELKA